ncbi:MAG: hypothetical protein RJA07_2692 [Bacteroidota bacterium]|jgi:hypothetical protein
MKHTFLSFLFLLFASALFAQQKTDSASLKNRKDKFSININGGLTHMKPNIGVFDLSKSKGVFHYNYGCEISYKIYKRLNIYVAYNRETLEQEDFYRKNVNNHLYFNMNAYQGGLNIKTYHFKRFFLYTKLGYKYSEMWQYSYEDNLWLNISSQSNKHFFWKENEQSIVFGGFVQYQLFKNIIAQLNIVKTVGLTEFLAYDSYNYKLQYFIFNLGFIAYLH